MAILGKSKNTGFTLIELLIVVAIISILAGALILAINPGELMREARDARRLSEVDTIARAINLALADEEIELTECNSNCNSEAGSVAVDGTGWVTFTVVGADGFASYLNALPIDPINDSSGGLVFTYQADATNQTFELTVVLEAEDNAPKMTTDGGNQGDAYEIGTDPGLDLISTTPPPSAPE